MNSKMRLSLLACALGAASIASAQTSNEASPPNDGSRSPGSVTTPVMPVVVSPPRDDAGVGTAGNRNSRRTLPVVRSLGSDTSESDQTLSGDKMIDGAATGGVAPNSGGKDGLVGSGTKASDNAGAETASGTGANAAGANSGTGDSTGEAGSTMRNQYPKQSNELNQDENNQPSKSTAVPATRADITRTGADTLGDSSGEK
jgi:hypothetical protein